VISRLCENYTLGGDDKLTLGEAGLA